MQLLSCTGYSRLVDYLVESDDENVTTCYFAPIPDWCTKMSFVWKIDIL